MQRYITSSRHRFLVQIARARSNVIFSLQPFRVDRRYVRTIRWACGGIMVESDRTQPTICMCCVSRLLFKGANWLLHFENRVQWSRTMMENWDAWKEIPSVLPTRPLLPLSISLRFKIASNSGVSELPSNRVAFGEKKFLLPPLTFRSRIDPYPPVYSNIPPFFVKIPFEIKKNTRKVGGQSIREEGGREGKGGEKRPDRRVATSNK